MHVTAMALGLCLIAGPAATSAGLPAQTSYSEPTDFVPRGHVLAQRICASCHAVELTGASPDRRAPTFRSLAGKYVPLTLQRLLTDIAETGHSDMPSVRLDSDQVDDIVAYMNSLERE